MSINMTREEREDFLAGVHVGIISIGDLERGPLTVPIWYDYSPERGVWIITSPSSRKGRLLETAGRFSLCAQDERPPYKYVSVEGPIRSKEPMELDRHLRPMARRYLGDELGDRYVEQEPAEGSVVYVMRPERWLTVDYSKMADW